MLNGSAASIGRIQTHRTTPLPSIRHSQAAKLRGCGGRLTIPLPWIQAYSEKRRYSSYSCMIELNTDFADSTLSPLEDKHICSPRLLASSSCCDPQLHGVHVLFQTDWLHTGAGRFCLLDTRTVPQLACLCVPPEQQDLVLGLLGTRGLF